MRRIIKPRKLQVEKQQSSQEQMDEMQKDEPSEGSFDMNIKSLQEIFSSSSDFVLREFHLFGSQRTFIAFMDGLVDTQHLDMAVLKPLMYHRESVPDSIPELAKQIEEDVISIAQTQILTKHEEVVQKILLGQAVLLMELSNKAIAMDVKGMEQRAVEQPATERVVRGPRIGFVENIRTNTSLIRRVIHNQNLKMESYTIGEASQTSVVISYIAGIVLEPVLDEVRKRISRIQIDAVLESNYIQEMIQDAPFSPFPTIQVTERPDIASSSLLEGKVIIIVDGTPFVLIAPTTFWAEFQTAEDYYQHFTFAAFIRLLRYISAVLSLTLPALYVALTTFHQEMIPTSLALSIAASREGIPFPAIIEALIMEFTFDVLREAGLRLPTPLGQTIGIVGGLVIGQAAVQAGIVSAPMVIVVSLTGICSFTVPRVMMNSGLRLLRFPVIFLSGTLGLYGIAAGLIALLIHLVNLRSFGVPYFTPVAPFDRSGMKDIFFRAPWWAMRKRPRFAGLLNQTRVPSGQKPNPRRES